ncbi:hypothetical protein CRUP_019126, partial [Coryphaenoides rupestris]
GGGHSAPALCPSIHHQRRHPGQPEAPQVHLTQHHHHPCRPAGPAGAGAPPPFRDRARTSAPPTGTRSDDGAAQGTGGECRNPAGGVLTDPAAEFLEVPRWSRQSDATFSASATTAYKTTTTTFRTTTTTRRTTTSTTASTGGAQDDTTTNTSRCDKRGSVDAHQKPPPPAPRGASTAGLGADRTHHPPRDRHPLPALQARAPAHRQTLLPAREQPGRTQVCPVGRPCASQRRHEGGVETALLPLLPLLSSPVPGGEKGGSCLHCSSTVPQEGDRGASLLVACSTDPRGEDG